jgi:hypothetical protein
MADNNRLELVVEVYVNKANASREADPERRVFLLWMTEYFRRQLESTLGILGITVPQYM